MFLNRAAKKCELSVGRGSRPPPFGGLEGGRVGLEKTGVSQALSGVRLGIGAKASASRGGGEEVGAGKKESLGLITVGSPETLPLPSVHLALRIVSKIASW